MFFSKLKHSGTIATSILIGIGSFGFAQDFPTVVSQFAGNDGISFQGDDDFDRLGLAMVPAGDFNGDGIDDLMLIAPSVDVSGEDTEEGEIYILFGGTGAGSAIALRDSVTGDFDPDTLDGTNGIVLQGAQPDDSIGWFAIGEEAAITTRDFNDDGNDDIAFARARQDSFNLRNDPVDSVYIVYGGNFTGSTLESAQKNNGRFNMSNIDGTNGLQIFGGTGSTSTNSFGINLAAGDLNNDGVNDLAIAARNFAGNSLNLEIEGGIIILFGGSSAGSISSLGESENGILDLLDLTPENSAIIGEEVNGSTSGFNGISADIASGGDFNGDGIDDLLIGAEASGYGGSGSGSVIVMFGGTETDSILDQAANNETDPGLLIMSPSIFDGTNMMRIDGSFSSQRFGAEVDFAGDINNDGTDDIIVGSPTANLFEADSGVGFLIFGGENEADDYFLSLVGDGSNSVNVSEIDGENGLRLRSAAAFDELGYRVTGLGDVSGDGIDDFAMSAPGDHPGTVNLKPGAVYIVFGGTGEGSAIDLATGSGDFTLSSFITEDARARFTGNVANSTSNQSSEIGRTLSGNIDFNGDGVNDVLLGSYLYDRQFELSESSNSGIGFVLFGTVQPKPDLWILSGQ